MKIILEGNLKKLVVDDEEHNVLLDRNDLEKPEEERYYFKFAYLPPTTTIEQCEEKYIELVLEEESEVE